MQLGIRVRIPSGAQEKLQVRALIALSSCIFYFPPQKDDGGRGNLNVVLSQSLSIQGNSCYCSSYQRLHREFTTNEQIKDTYGSADFNFVRISDF